MFANFFFFFTFFFILIFLFLALLVPILITVAYFTLYERKLMGHVQRRKGPNVVGFYGVLQPLADGGKLFLKELIFPLASNSSLFIFAPILSLLLSFVMWAFIPFNIDYVLIDVNLTVLFFFITSSFGVYAVILAGWASNSVYAFLGGIRSTAQMISYEICLGFILVILSMYAGSLNLTDIVLAQQTISFSFVLTPLMVMFFVCIVAETNRAPFDLPEAEAEIVAGYNVEYSAMMFAMFFLAEYANILLMCVLFISFFFSGWLCYFPFFSGVCWFAFKTNFCVIIFILIRAALPRYRYDLLMVLGWKVFLPISFALIFFYSGVLYSFGSFVGTQDILYGTFEFL